MGVREEERFTNLVGAANPRWESLNFGVPGYGTDQALLLWEHIASRYVPDLVVLTVYQNDYGDNMYVVRSGRTKPYFELREDVKLVLRNAPVGPGDFWRDGVFDRAAPPYASLVSEPVQRRSRVAHWLAKHSDLARLGYTLVRAWDARAGARENGPAAPGGGAAGPGDVAPTALEQVQARLLTALVGRLATAVRDSGARFAVIVAGDDVPQHHLLRASLQETAIPHVDATTGELAKRLAGGRQVIYYRYSRHWTPAAHRAVADLVANAVRGQGLCAGREAPPS
jgi:hypothetical protein